MGKKLAQTIFHGVVCIFNSIIMTANCMMLVREDVLGIEQLYSLCLTFYYTSNMQASKHTERVIRCTVQRNLGRTTTHVLTVTYMIT